MYLAQRVALVVKSVTLMMMTYARSVLMATIALTQMSAKVRC